MSGLYINREDRRSQNQVWTAAGNYEYQPDFLSNMLYMNLIIGFACRVFGSEWLHETFESWKGDRKQDAFDELAWLLLEKECYEHEISYWPALSELRKEYAVFYLKREELKSKQEHLNADAAAAAVEKAHWQEIAGGIKTPMFPKEAALYRELKEFEAESPKEWREQFANLLLRYYGFDGSIRSEGVQIQINRWMAAFLRRVLPKRIKSTPEMLQFGRAEKSGQHAGDLALVRIMSGSKGDLAYIESCFGRLSCSDKELYLRENLFCRGRHADCHLWFTNGERSDEKSSQEGRHAAYEAKEQEKLNREHFQENFAFYNSVIKRLKEQIGNCLMTQDSSSSILSRGGSLDTERVWRSEALNDPRVFLYREDEPVPALTVELLLDASASRMNSRELIAAQGYILSESLRQCGIPVQVDSFCTIRGYTVLSTLKPMEDTDSSRGIFRYFTAGWNRDSLALKAAGMRLMSAKTEKKLMIVLTDAHPNDSQGLRNSSGGGFARDYDGEAAINDTAEVVYGLRKEGIRIAALVTGRENDESGAVKIYGRQGFTRIRSMDRLAAAAEQLICRELG